MEQICSKIPFGRGYQVHAVKDRKGCIEWISLYDLCRILKRTAMYESGEIFRICRSTKGFPVYSNGKRYQFVRLCDIPPLLRSVRQENRNISAICDEIEKWLASLPEGGMKELINPPTANSRAHPVTFTFHEQPVSFLTDNGTTFFNATQMARIFGKNPREWLLLAETVHFRQSLVRQGESESSESRIITTRGSQGATWIEYRLGLAFARWLSLEFFRWCGERIQELIGRGYPVLMKNDSNNRPGQFPVPTTLKDALQLTAIQQEKIEADHPKVAFYDDFIENRDFFKSSIIAEELRITTACLHRFLMEEKICRYERRQYAVYPAYSALQCDFPYMWTNKYGKAYTYSHQKRWTKAGREFILELYRKKNPPTGSFSLLVNDSQAEL